MDAALGWLGNLFEWFGRWIPKIIIVRATHGGVKFVRGYKIKEMRPGVHIYWPIVTDVEIIETARQTMNLKSQRLTTKDDRAISVSVVVIYGIDDVVKALTQTWDYSDTIGDSAQSAVIEVLSKLTYHQIMDEVDETVAHEMTKRIRMRLKKYGVRVEASYLTDYAETLVLTMINGD